MTEARSLNVPAGVPQGCGSVFPCNRPGDNKITLKSHWKTEIRCFISSNAEVKHLLITFVQVSSMTVKRCWTTHCLPMCPDRVHLSIQTCEVRLCGCSSLWIVNSPQWQCKSSYRLAVCQPERVRPRSSCWSLLLVNTLHGKPRWDRRWWWGLTQACPGWPFNADSPQWASL